MTTLSPYERVTFLLVLGILTTVTSGSAYGHGSQSILSLEYWIDSSCGSDTNAGSSKENPFATFEPLETLLPLPSASSVTVWLSPGLIPLQTLSWPYSTSIKIAKCDGNCPSCSSREGPVTIQISPFNTSNWLPALHQLPQTLTDDTNQLSRFELEQVTLVSSDFVLESSIIVISRANTTFRAVHFSNFEIDSQDSMILFVNQSIISFEDCEWKNISCVGSECQTLLVQAAHSTSFSATRIQTSSFSMIECTVRHIQSKETSSRLFLIDSSLKVSLVNSHFDQIATMRSTETTLGGILTVNQTMLLGNPIVFLLRNVTMNQAEGTLIWLSSYNSRMEVEDCLFTSNKGRILFIETFTSIISETYVSIRKTIFKANFYQAMLVSGKSLSLLEIANCTFLDNTYTRMPFTIPIVSAVATVKVIISHVTISVPQPVSEAIASGAGFELEASLFEVDHVTFSDISINMPGDLMKFWVVGLNNPGAKPHLVFTHLSFLRLSTGLTPFGNRLLSFDVVRGSGNLPQIQCAHITFDNIFFSNSLIESARDALISASKLDTFDLMDLRVNNVTFGSKPGHPITHEVNRVPTSFIALNQISSVRLEQIRVTDAYGNVEVESCPMIVFRQFEFISVSAPQIISVLGFLEASMSAMSFDTVSGTAMQWSDGQRIAGENLSFTQCRANIGDGGGLHITKVDHIRLTNARFFMNAAATGGGLFVWDTKSLLMEGGLVYGNRASSGGGIRAQSDSIIISNTNFTSNQVESDGGALSLITDHLLLSGASFLDNTASWGGAISFQYLPTTPYKKLLVELNATRFLSNRASIHGGALFIPLAYHPLVSLSMTNVSAIENSAYGRVIKLQPLPFPNQFPLDNSGFGGFLCSPYPLSLFVQHSSFLSNDAVCGGAFFLSGQFIDSSAMSSSHLHITQSNFTQNFASSNGGAISLQHIQSTNQTFQSNFAFKNSASLGGFLSTYKAFVSLFYSHSGSMQDSDISEDGDKDKRPTSNKFISNFATAGGILFSANNPLEIETKFSGQYFERNHAVIGAIALYTSVSSFSLQSSPCYPPNICLGNFVQGYGVERATLSVRLKMDLPDRKTLHVFSFTTRLAGHLLDDFGQIYNDGLRSPIFMELLGTPSEPPIENPLHSFSSINSTFGSHTGSDFEVTLSSLVTASYYENGKANVQFLLINPAPVYRNVTLKLSVSTASPYYQLNLTVGGCPVGMAMDEIFGCVPCPSGDFSLTNGIHCTSCPTVSHLSCVEGKILTSRGYWVISNPNNSSIQPVLCPFPDRCLGSNNQCSSGRTGFLCSFCDKGLSESWTSSCTNCSRPNWPLLCLVFLALWIITIVLHILISTSSGKATILVYFLQTSYLLISDVPISPFFQAILGKPPGSGPGRSSKLINFFLCLFPMDIFQRQLLFASIPFIMALQLLITFSLYYLWSIMTQTWKMFQTRKATKDNGLTLSSNLSLDVDSDPGSMDHFYTEDGVQKEDDPLIATESNTEVNSEQDLSMEIYHDEIDPMSAESELMATKVSLSSINDGEEVLLDMEPLSTVNDHLEQRLCPTQLSAFEINEIHKETKFFHTSRLIRSVVYFWAQSFSSVLGFVMIFSDCRLIPGFLNHPYMAKSPSISCHSQTYNRWKLSLIATIPWILGILAFLSYRLFYGRWKGLLNNHDVKYGILYEMFRPKFFFWKLFELFRRFVLAIPVLPGKSLVEKSNLSAAIMVSMFVAQFLAKPYAQKLENNLALFTLAALVLLALIPTWNPHSNPTLLVAIPAIILTVVVLVTFATTATLLRTQLKRCWQRRQS